MSPYTEIETLHYSPWIAFSTLLTREVLRYMKLAVQTIGAPFLSNLLFLAIFAGLPAGRLAGTRGPEYLRFLIPGLVLMGTLLSAFQNPLFSLVTMKYQNTLQDLSRYPLSGRARFLAFSLAGTLRGVLVGVMTYLAAGLFGGYAIERPLLFWGFIACVAFVAAAAGIAAGLYLDSFERANFVVALLLTPALYLGGVFFPTAGAPAWLRPFAVYNPLSALVGAARHFYLGAGTVGAPVTILLGVALCLGAVTVSARAVARGQGLKVE
jgi:ABC-2 type transport system permease protein